MKLSLSKKRYFNKIKTSQLDLSKIIGKNNSVLIFGAGRLGRKFLTKLQENGIIVKAIIDNNESLWGSKMSNIEVIPVKNAKKYTDLPVIIASILYGNEIYKLLKKNHFKHIYTPYYLNLINSKIFSIPQISNMFESVFNSKNQSDISKVEKLLSDKESKMVLNNLIKFRITADYKYIDNARSKHKIFMEKSILGLMDKEIFVDCGAYDGDSIELFLKAVNSKYDKIYGFEPDIHNFRELKKWHKDSGKKNIFLIKKGVYSQTGIINFDDAGTVDSKIPNKSKIYKDKTELNLNNNNYISVIKLDKYFINKPKPTLIKMDIEGAEVEALMGAEEIIKHYKPKLAISVYHKPTDLWKIILMLNKFDNSYKFYLRHFTDEIADTICYAV